MLRPATALVLAGLAGIGPALAGPPQLDLDVRLEPAGRTLEVTGRIVLEPGPGTVTLALAPRFEVTRFAVDGREAAVQRGPRGAWQATLASGQDDHVLEIDYRGTLAPLDEGQGRGGGVGPVADPRGSFVPERAGWLPRVDGKVFTYRITLDVPEDQRALVPGRLDAEAVEAGRYRATFTSETPQPGLVLLAGPYEVTERIHNGVRLRTYFVPEIAELADGYLDDTARYLDLYQSWVGPYPFSAFHVVSGPLPLGLGYPNLTYIGTRVLRLPFIRGSSLGHEVLHNWWGNGVYVDYARGNWSEGLTTFMADYTYALERDPAEARAMRLQWLRDFNALPPERETAVVAFVAKAHGAAQVVGYNKVAAIFHMLRREIGADAFDAGIRRFWAENFFQVAGWSNLQAAFEEAAGRSLERFFAQWLERRGAPALHMDELLSAVDGSEYRVSFTLRQDEPAYALSVPVRIGTVAGAEQFEVKVDGPQTSVALWLKDRPTEVAVDPDFDLFRRLAPGEAPPILRDVMLSDAAQVVLPDSGGPARDAAAALAQRMMDVEPSFAEANAAAVPDAPLLIAGTTDAVLQFLDKSGLPATPEELDGRGNARAWATRDVTGRALVVVTAETPEALAALQRGLPHYGRRGYVVFEDGKAIDKGGWPLGQSPLTRSLGLD
ncbi:MAG: M1 family aminopeptidase [Alphaproteobacteria bacterium]|nr:M1 family aminopeptidase [Alphaproteobacteria bacterium]